MSRKLKDSMQYVLIYISAFLCVVSLFFIILFILQRGLSYIDLDFLTNSYSPSKENAGILPMIVGYLLTVQDHLQNADT